jgi:hypothetical protein
VLSQEPYREVLIDMFNKLLGNFNYASQTIDLWNEIHKRLLVYFPGFPTHSELVAEAPTPAIQAGQFAFYSNRLTRANSYHI